LFSLALIFMGEGGLWGLGCFLNVLEKEKVQRLLAKWGDGDEVDYIVVSDGEEVSDCLSGLGGDIRAHTGGGGMHRF